MRGGLPAPSEPFRPLVEPTQRLRTPLPLPSLVAVGACIALVAAGCSAISSDSSPAGGGAPPSVDAGADTTPPAARDAGRDAYADDTGAPDASPDAGSRSCGVPTSFKWSSTGPIIAPALSSLTAIKDPSVFFFDDRWNVYASTTDSRGNYNSTYLSFTDWSSAGSAPQTNLSGGVAPEVFYFAPQKLWYRVYEWPDVYDTSSDPTQPTSWSNRKNFYSKEPDIVVKNRGNGGWIDFWVICDEASCFLFFSDDNGHLYRAKTPIENFPNGFGEPVIVLSDPNPGRLFEASNVYRMKGTGQYLLLVEAYDSASNGARYFRSWTAPSLDGAWTPLQAEYDAPFASAKNVTFTGEAWSKDISHGEMLRSGYDEKLEIDTCDLKFLYQGKSPTASGGYNTLPWRLGLLSMN
jgi:endo-1,4-beta-xylanase